VNAKQMPFVEESFDAVFTNGYLYEWGEPKVIFDEIYRVLKKGGLYYVRFFG
jgi:ubiquinone/menaquinone biosynthesis C-methylase UbiE